MAKIVKCPVCKESFDRLSTLSQFYKNRWHHQDCYDCKIIDEAKALETKEQRKQLHEVICTIFDYKAPGPRIMQQIKKFHDELEFSYEHIRMALEYFYIVKHNSIKKANGGIGIVPYVIEDAVRYFGAIEYKQNLIAKGTSQLQNPVSVVVVNFNERDNNKNRKEINLDDI